MSKNNIIVLPARQQSQRLANKLLLEIEGKSILQRSFEQARKSKLANKVAIVTDSKEILSHAENFCDEVFVSDQEHSSGTSRIAELAAKKPDWHYIINLQADEPFINPEDIDNCFKAFEIDQRTEMLSMYHAFSNYEDVKNPNNVKVIFNSNKEALYFSRSIIPFPRDNQLNLNSEFVSQNYFKHVGIYGFKRETLLYYSKLSPSMLENIEKLEQLKALEAGITIKMLKTDSPAIGIDTAEDLELAKDLLKTGSV